MDDGPADDAMIGRLQGLFGRRGTEAYLGEAVSVATHMLQCAALARVEGAPDSLVAAALLHDVGHITEPTDAYSPDDTTDHRHEEIGADFLRDHFPPNVVEPIRLHVAAKRYLCAVDPDYAARLSPASQHSLILQGGAMDGPEVAAFEREPFFREAVLVRQWDDAGKIRDLAVPSIDGYRALLETLIRQKQKITCESPRR